MRFLLGFATASVFWALAAALLYTTDIIAIVDEPSDRAQAAVGSDEEQDAPREGNGRRRARRSKTARPSRDVREDRDQGAHSTDEPAIPTGEATSGDDLDWNADRRVDMAAGEGQLSGTQIEAGFDGAMGKIRRCLVLVPGSGEVTGKLTFGMRVGADGVPRAVNLTGPAAVTSGESGSCLRAAAQGVRFAKFDGPDMLFRYPIVLH